MIRTAPTLPLVIIEKILRDVPSSKDRINCRLVCYNWMCVIDLYVGVNLRLTRENKAKLFASELLRSCTSLKILYSAGTLNWYVCYFSPRNLKSVEIFGTILTENWKLLLEQCESIEFLTITTQILTKIKKIFYLIHQPFDFPADFLENKIDHPSLRRLVFQGVCAKKKKIVPIANMMNSIGIVPRLRQIIILYEGCSDSLIYRPLKNAFASLMERNPAINSAGFLSYDSAYTDMKIWDRLLQENKSCWVQHYFAPAHSLWWDVHQKLLTVDEFFCGYLIQHGNFNIFREFINLMLLRAQRNLKKIFFQFATRLPLDCRLLLEGLEHILELSLCHYKVKYLGPQLINLDILSNFTRLEYLYISTPLSEINIDSIFSIPRLKELHIKHQETAVEFRNTHVQMALNHDVLKLIFWEKALQNKWNQLSAELKCDNWQFVELKRKALRILTKIGRSSKKISYVEVPDEGVVPETKWKEKFADNFVLFHKTRLEAADWAMINEVSKHPLNVLDKPGQ